MDTNLPRASNERTQPPTGGLSPADGGYDLGHGASLYNTLGEKMTENEIRTLECPLCLKILRDPVQLITCGCRYCSVCIDRLRASNTNKSESGSTNTMCPVDSTPYSPKKHVRKDRGCVKEIAALQVDCQKSCGWKGFLIKAEEHLNNDCPRVEITCSLGCEAVYPRSQHREHLKDCMKQSVSCSYCSISVTKNDLEEHYRGDCLAYPISCDYCHEPLLKRSQLQKHVDEDCTEYEMECPLKKMIACQFKAKRATMLKHSEKHVLLMFETVSKLCVSVQTLTSQNDKLALAVQQKDVTIAQLNEQVGDADWHQVEKDHAHSRGEVLNKLDGASSFGVRGASTGMVKGDTRTSNWESKTSDWIATDGIGGSDAKRMGMLMETSENNRVKLIQLAESVQVLQGSMNQQSMVVDEIRLRQDILDVRTTNGIFIWKIPEVRRRYREAIDRRTVSIYSPPYFTSSQGYRICTRVYLNGDGMGKGTHISVFFVLMKSDQDSLLPWPFKQSVRFTLLNQVKPSASITEAFAPDLRSPSFQQPQGEMNIASGFPKFAKQSVLNDEEFTKGNTIFVKAQVDMSGLVLP